MADSSLTPGKSTDIHAGVNLKKKTTRVNLMVVVAVVVFLALGVLMVVKGAHHPPQAPADANPLTP
jgi:hypothetical protein